MPKSGTQEKKKKQTAVKLPSSAELVSPPPGPLHVLYGGAHLFASGVFEKVSRTALNTLRSHFPDPVLLATAFALPEVQALSFTDRENLRLFFEKKLEEKPKLSSTAALLCTVYERLAQKLETEAVEDYRIDFEDGYGYRNSDEEDLHAENAGAQAAIAFRNETLPRFFGIRVKPLTKENGFRSAATLMIFLESFVKQSRGKFPASFIVTLPKVTEREQIVYLNTLLAKCEKKFQLPFGTLKIELMVEHPLFMKQVKGKTLLERAVKICGARLTGLHLGVYDYLSALGIAGSYQNMQHFYCDMLRTELKTASYSYQVSLSDGVTTLLPVVKYKENSDNPLTQKQREENRSSIGEGLQQSMNDIMHSYQMGFYQGWDVHPNQLIARYFTAYYFFRKEMSANTERLKKFLNEAAQASRSGSNFDDAASAYGLLNFFRRGLLCKAFSAGEIEAAGLDAAELLNSSFRRLLYGAEAEKK